MKSKKLALCLLVIMLTMSFICIKPAFAVGEGEWITKYTVEDADTGELLLDVDFAEEKYTQLGPILGGTNLLVTFTVKVTSGSGDLQLKTSMAKATGEDAFWDLLSEDYELGDAYNPASASTTFNWEKGTFEMTCTGRVRAVTKPTNVSLVELLSAGDVLDNIKPLVVTSEGSEFESLYEQYEERLQSLTDSGVSAGYLTLYENILEQSRALDTAGNTAEAIALLGAIPTTGEPMGSALEMVFIPLIGVLAALAVIFVVMFLRVRGKVGYFRLVVEDQIKDLEGLTLRASKIDRSMSSSLESVKDRLKNLVGV